MKKIKIKNTKKNIFYMLLGRLATCAVVYSASLWVCYKVLEFIIDNCITTLK